MRKARRWVLRLREAFARAACLVQRVPPCSVELQHLRAMDETTSGERHHVRLQRPPLRESSRPFARAAHLVHLLAGKNDAAVHDPGNDRRDVLGGDRDHALVEQAEPFVHLSGPNQHVALAVDGKGEQVPVAKALADPNGISSGGGSRGEVPRSLVLEHHGQQQVAVLGAFGFVFEKPLRTAEPPPCRAELAP